MFQTGFFLCSKLAACLEDMKNQVSYWNKADQMRRCALQGRNCKLMHERLLQILGEFRPIWNTTSILNEQRLCFAPVTPSHCSTPCWRHLNADAAFPGALTVALLPFSPAFPYLYLLPFRSILKTVPTSASTTQPFLGSIKHRESCTFPLQQELTWVWERTLSVSCFTANPA